VRRLALVVAAAACAACSGSLGSVALLGRSADPVGVKMLRPGVSGRACRTSWFGVLGEAGEPTIADAARSIYALDAEGDVLTEATVRRTAIVTGVYNRRCLEVEANLARVVPTVVVPMPAGHGGHH
jgi:hypothetical protein